MLNYTDHLPLEWTPQGHVAVDDTQRLTTNLYVLEAVAAVEDNASDRLHEEQPELHLELQRLDAKLQLLLDMVARLLSRDGRFPRRHTVRIAVDRIDIAAGMDGMAVGDEGVLYLHLHPAIPVPLLLPGAIVDDTRDDAGQWLHFQPDSLSEAESEALSRHVFRHHRRSIAAARQAETGD